jgi:hypothetical protein
MRKDKIVACFVAVFYYAVLPASCLFSVVSGIIMSCYSFKGTLFFLTGSPSLTGMPLPASLAISVWELVAGIVFVALGALLLWMYTRFKRTTAGLMRQITDNNVQFIGDATPLEEETVVVTSN